MNQFDPLKELEKQLDAQVEMQLIAKKNIQKIKVGRAKVIFTTYQKTLSDKIFSGVKFATTYALLSATIFGVMMGAMNIPAYSERISLWLNPNVYAESARAVDGIISASNAEILAQNQKREDVESRAIIEQKIAEKNPEMVYSRSYGAENLLSNIPLGSTEKATFEVAPQENRIIIPKLGKNIPLIDVDHDEGTPFTEMHKIFMKELEKGIVRYPGTAKPGEVGNAFIFGHSSNYYWEKGNYNTIFATLDQLEKGDEIIVYYNQKKFIYRVTDESVVKPGDTKALNSRDPKKKEISLMTCWPVGTTNERLIVFGELVEEK